MASPWPKKANMQTNILALKVETNKQKKPWNSNPSRLLKYYRNDDVNRNAVRALIGWTYLRMTVHNFVALNCVAHCQKTRTIIVQTRHIMRVLVSHILSTAVTVTTVGFVIWSLKVRSSTMTEKQEQELLKAAAERVELRLPVLCILRL